MCLGYERGYMEYSLEDGKVGITQSVDSGLQILILYPAQN